MARDGDEIRPSVWAGGPGEKEPILRPPEPGDMGWIVERHGALYAREYGFDVRFEGLVAEIVARFAGSHDPARERCWIAELGGQRVGSVLLARRTEDEAQLRLLLVEPEARGRGLGMRLVDEVLRFAADSGYRRISLWTNDVLADARRLYERAGFRLVSEEPNERFGSGLTAQTWARDLPLAPVRRNPNVRRPGQG